MKILLPFDLLPHLDGTGIASSFGLRNRSPENHTVVELSFRDTQDFWEVLKTLEDELANRCQKWQRFASKSPIAIGRRTAVEQRLQIVRRAVEHVSDKLSGPQVSNEQRST